MIALITGATGFIGGALAAALADDGWEVRVLVRPSGRARLADPDRYRVIEAELPGPSDVLGRAADGCDVVFHVASIRDRWGTSPAEYRRANIEGTRGLLEASRGRAGRFVYVSSVGVHGWPGVDGIDESFPVSVRPGQCDYHGTKAAAEELVRSWTGGPEPVIVRPTITYGPGDRDGMLSRLIGLVARGRFVRVGQGTNHFHLTYIDDLVRGLVLAGTHPDAAGETFILAGPRSIAVREMVGLIERSRGLPPRSVFLPVPLAWPAAWAIETAWRSATAVGLPLPGSGPPVTATKLNILCAHRSFSSAKAESLLGFEARVDYSEGLGLTLDWMKESGLLPRAWPRSPAVREA